MDPVIQAKQYLQQRSGGSDVCLYDHLTDLVSQLLEKRPENPLDIFESVSSQIKKQRLNPISVHAPLGFKNVPDHTLSHEQARLLLPILQARTKTEEEPTDESSSGQLTDIIDLANLFENAGVGLGKEETFLLTLTIHQLVHEHNLQSIRFWGKILCTAGSYYIVEGEGGDPNAEEVDGSSNTSNVEASKPAVEEIPPELIGFLKQKPATVHELPKEEVGTKWIRLPDVQPHHITEAKAIRKLMTGDLNKPIISYPAFHGTEAHYLRAQIARISAATVVCPQGYYTFDPENADTENPETQSSIIVNNDYTILSNSAMLSLENWVHQIPYILPQGRTVWVHPTPDAANGEGDANEEEEHDKEPNEEDSGQATNGQDNEELEPESGPNLLTSISEDQALQPNVPAWSVRACSRLLPSKFSTVHLKSNRWLGAHAVYYQNKFACMYVGNGLKELGSTLSASYEAPKLPEFMQEYQVPEHFQAEGVTHLKEQVDPTIAQEKEYEEHLQQMKDDAMPEEDDEENHDDPQ